MLKTVDVDNIHKINNITSDDLEAVIDEQLENQGYECTGTPASDFTQGFITGFEYCKKLLNERVKL